MELLEVVEYDAGIMLYPNHFDLVIRKPTQTIEF